MSQAIELSLNPLLAARGAVLPCAKHVFGQLREVGDAGSGRALPACPGEAANVAFTFLYLF